MTAAALEVRRAGVQSTVQDLGRPGYLATGMPPSGPADRFALGIANLLVGNDPGDRYLVGRRPGAAGLEVLLGHLELRAQAEAVVAVTGADVAPTVNGRSVPMWQALALAPGDVLVFHGARSGARAYLGVAGGVDVPTFAGSRATNVRAGVGGIGGRALRAGDVVRTFPSVLPARELAGRALRAALVPAYPERWTVRVVLGPQDDLFLPESVETFLAHDWALSPTSDRMGCRYVGPALHFNPRPSYLVEQAGSDPSNIVDDTIPVGGIQVPGGLEPIVLHVDGPSLGGYAKIATVISADLGRVGQTRPGQRTRFVAVSPDDGVAALRELEGTIAEASVERP